MREVEYFDSFDEVIIFSLSIRAGQRDTIRELPIDNVRVLPVHFRSHLFYAINAVFSVLNPALWAEIGLLLRHGRFRVLRLIQAIAHYSRADYEARLISRYLRRTVEDKAGDETVLYAYRFLYQPYLASRIAKAFGRTELIGRAHGIDLYEERSSTNYLPGRVRNLKVLDELHVVSRHGEEYLRGCYPQFADKIRTSYLGTDDRGLRAERPADGVLRLVSCSSVVRVKRLGLIVDALKQLPADSHVEWVHYGDGEEFNLIRKAAEAIPAHVGVEFKGWVANDEVLRAYREGKHDVLINVSSSEGLPVSMMEACSVGIPVIATDVGGTREIVKDGVNGILLPADVDAAIIARAIQDFANMSEAEFAGKSRAAREVWEAEFNSEANYTNFLRALRHWDV